MSESAAPLGRRGRLVLVLIGAGILTIVALANTHLVYVASTSQPDCVPHLKAPDGSGTAFRAAKSAC